MECKSLKEIWYRVNMVSDKTKNLTSHPHPDEEANEHIKEWAKASSLTSLPQSTRDDLDTWETDRMELIASSLNITTKSCQNITTHELLRAVKSGKSAEPG